MGQGSSDLIAGSVAFTMVGIDLLSTLTAEAIASLTPYVLGAVAISAGVAFSSEVIGALIPEG